MKTLEQLKEEALSIYGVFCWQEVAKKYAAQVYKEAYCEGYEAGVKDGFDTEAWNSALDAAAEIVEGVDKGLLYWHKVKKSILKLKK